MAEESEFIKHLREEKLKAQETRSAYTQKKLTYVTALLGIGVLKIEQLDLNPVLYLVPFVAAAFDLYILGEDYSVKRIGAYLQAYSSEVIEQRWEKWISKNRDPFAPIAMPILSTLMLAGAAVIIWISAGGKVPSLYLLWLIVGSLPSWILFFLYRRLRDQIPEKMKAIANGRPDLSKSWRCILRQVSWRFVRRRVFWWLVRRRVAGEDHVVNRKVYDKIKRQFLSSLKDLPGLQKIAPEYDKPEFLLCVDSKGKPIPFTQDVVLDFEETLARNPDFKRWFKTATFPQTGDAGLLVARWLCHLLGIRHRAVHLFIDHPTLDGHTFVQVRGLGKAESPGAFDLPAAGHVVGLESIRDALFKELEEELGLESVDICDLQQIGSYEYQGSKDSAGVYNIEIRTVFHSRLKSDRLLRTRFPDGEVAAISMFELSELQALIDVYPERIASGLYESFPVYLKCK